MSDERTGSDKLSTGQMFHSGSSHPNDGGDATPREPRKRPARKRRTSDDYKHGYSMICNVVSGYYFPMLDRSAILLYLAIRRLANPGFTTRRKAADLAEKAGISRAVLYKAREQIGPRGLGLISWSQTNGGRWQWATYTITRNPPRDCSIKDQTAPRSGGD